MASSSPRRAAPAEAAHTPVPALAPLGLEQARAVVEARFLAAGEVLGLAVDGVAKLIGALDQLAGALDPQTVEATRAELATAAERLLELRLRLDRRRDGTRGLGRLVDGLRGGIEDMRRELAYLRVFALNIKVTSAGVAGAGEDFAFFAQEISDRIETGRQELEAFASEVATLYEQLTAALLQEQALAGQCERLIPAVPEALGRCADDIVGHHAKVAQVATEVGDLARGIQRKVGSALAALQVGDSTRQRIEHVQNGLRLVEAAGMAADAQARAAGAVCPLLSAQLAAAAADFNRDAAQIHQSMAGIAADAAELLRLRDLAFGRGGEAFLDRMILQLGEASDLVGRVEAAEDDAVATARGAAAAVEALNRRIAALQAIKTDVQQMALNTTLKCARMGDPGKPLSVIAIELRSHAGLLEVSAQRALGVLGELAAAAGELVADHVASAAGEALAVATERLRKANTTVEADLSALADQGAKVVRALQDAAARLDFKGEIGAVLETAAASLRAPSRAPLEAADGPAVAEILQAIAKSYTMAQEREVHAALAAGLPQAAEPAPAEPAAAPADDLEDLLF
jgi:hypothetical protein